jgi:trehalose 6-phosphate synthase/phosphatase
MNKKLYILSNRLPVTINEDRQIHHSNGGLATAMNSFVCANGAKNFDEIVWAGVPGCGRSTWHAVSDELANNSFTYLPVFAGKSQYEGYYNEFSNSVLWPLFHYFPSYAVYKNEAYQQYLEVNQLFADTLLKELASGDTVWIQDYHLLPLAALLRKEKPDVSIGFFLHIPFPSYELFRLLPKQWQSDLLEGMLGADLVGFHTIDYASHFLKCVQMVLGKTHQNHVLQHDNRLITVDVFPISIDYQKFNDAYAWEDVAAKRFLLKDQLKDKQIIFSVDRLDYTKGVLNRLKAYKHFLKTYPAYRGHVVFVLVLAPSRSSLPKYTERKKLIDEYVSLINSSLGTVGWVPVIYQYKNLDFEEMTSLYTACHLAMVTPLRDGMNLVAKEFVASRQDQQGVLMLSEMAGAANELTTALLVNPNDVPLMAQKMKTALEMPAEEQQERLMAMQDRVSAYDVVAWAGDFLSRLDSIIKKQRFFQVAFLDAFQKSSLLDAYRNAESRLLLLDYDGTLASFQPQPTMAIPDEHLLALLKNLGEAENSDVCLISGRNSAWLEKYFGDLPLHLVAEHGARYKPKGERWQTHPLAEDSWKQDVRQLMEGYVKRCAHNFVEEKEFSIVWHYRNANVEQGYLRAFELGADLEEKVAGTDLQVMMGHCIVEVRQSQLSKGAFAEEMLANKEYEFVFAAGDDRTDEDMFRALSTHKNAFTIKVGDQASFAKFNLSNSQMIVSLLDNMSYLSLPVPA